MTFRCAFAVIGSSPLARGLLHRIWGGAHLRRIIPARAGFTLPHAGREFGRGDHPRSRGVYPVAAHADESRRRGSGIIPARAGFTQRVCAPAWIPVDHPRSRGVYATTVCTASWMPGSSPLARGLRVVGVADQPDRGIIPARAGFTTACGSRSRWTRDHPRSRGVYQGEAGPGGAGRGSSPLARGLPADRVGFHWVTGIIPARAGFTVPDVSAVGVHGDHPRSRGVYA